MTNTAIEYLYAGFSILPTKSDKSPLISWEKLKTTPLSEQEATKFFKTANGIGVICGKVSGGVECLDFDNKIENLDEIFKDFVNKKDVNYLINKYKIYCQKTKSGGYHFVYRYETYKYEGNKKLAFSGDNCFIETRGEGGYFVVYPTKNYTPIMNNICELGTMSEDERNFLIETAKSYSDTKTQAHEHTTQDNIKHDYTDPVSWFNINKVHLAKFLLEKKGWTKVRNTTDGIEYWKKPNKKDNSTSATFNKKENQFFIFSTSADIAPFKPECFYTPFQILVKLKYNNNFNKAINWILTEFFENNNDYIRVGSDYFKIIHKPDRFGIYRTELKFWKKDEIKQDFGSNFLDTIPKYDDFIIDPDNFEHKEVIKNCYNLYSKFAHTPEKGDFAWTKRLIDHVFGNQVDLGYKYLQCLYLHPKKILPVLVLASSQRSTGKSTFIDWLNAIFGNNMIVCNPDDITGSFNSVYAFKNIIAIEETLIEKNLAVEKIKSLATQKFISVNMKFVQQFKLPFYGKIIMATNNEDKFLKIDDDEIRFWVRKLNFPKFKNHNILEDLIKEIPAFLYYLTELPPLDFSNSRMLFTENEILNDELQMVKNESKSHLYKEITEYFTDFFNNDGSNLDFVLVSPKDIKEKWFFKDSKIEVNYIRRVIKTEFKKNTTDLQRYKAFGEVSLTPQVGTPFVFYKKDFINFDLNDDKILPF